jgi:glucose/arabinose dehydrogenase
MIMINHRKLLQRCLLKIFKPLIFLIYFSFLLGCNNQSEQTSTSNDISGSLEGDENNAGLSLPDGFAAVLVADNIGRARHIAVNNNGDIYVRLRDDDSEKSIVALRDTTGDGKADIIEYFNDYTRGSGIEINNNFLYFSSDTTVQRYPLENEKLIPEEAPEIIVKDFGYQTSHSSKPLTFDQSGNMYVTVGAPSNACQEKDRTLGSPGQDPCPLLDLYGGIWQFKADKVNQTQVDDGLRYATGIRNAMAIQWNTSSNILYGLQHGRDQLHQLYPEMYTEKESAELPAEEFLLIREGVDFGWPYCYYDPEQNKKILAPEYGGNGKIIGRCENAEDPIMAFPAHYAPNDLLFYNGNNFPDKYENGAFIAFHGSWNRAPLEQKGYNVVFVPFNGEKPSGEWEVFADGFAGTSSIRGPGDAEYRPMGLALGPDGSIYITDSQQGRIWRIFYQAS